MNEEATDVQNWFPQIKHRSTDISNGSLHLYGIQEADASEADMSHPIIQ